MGVPARLCWAMLAVAAAAHSQGASAAAAHRFVPDDPTFVVAALGAAGPGAELRDLLAASRAAPDDPDAALRLAAAFIERARTMREPRFYGRAEAVLARHARGPGASAAIRSLYADTLQHRHDFHRAEGLLDDVLRQHPSDADARLRRAALRLTRGDFAGARADCAQLAGHGGAHAAMGLACLAEALASSGDSVRARRLLATVPDSPQAEAKVRAYVWATRAQLAERAGDARAAIVGYRLALELAPDDDAVRAALSDVLAAQGELTEARRVLAVEKQSLALLVRAVSLASGEERGRIEHRARAWLALESARKDAKHEREAGLLELAVGSADEALAAARRNFEQQRELADVRLLARAAAKARDAAALDTLRAWLARTGYEDAVTQGILRRAVRG